MEKTPQKSHGIVNRAQNTLFAYQGWPTVCRDENGVLYAVASGMRLSHVCPFGKTVMYISRDDGKTWTPPIVINDTYLDDRDAGILYMGGGRMLVTWFVHSVKAYQTVYSAGIKASAGQSARDLASGMLESLSHVPTEYSHGGSFIRISEDYGVTWSETISMPISSPHGPNLCRDGSLIYLGKKIYNTETKDDDTAWGRICAYRSVNGGYNWEELATIAIPDGTRAENFYEPHVIDLPDGRLLGAIRAQGKEVAHGFTIYTTESTDGGHTWTTPVSLGVSGSPPHLMLHSSGALICSYGRREAPFGERALVSYDLGKSWTDDYILDDRANEGDLGYPTSVELDDGRILTVYYQRVEGDAKTSILCTEWKL